MDAGCAGAPEVRLIPERCENHRLTRAAIRRLPRPLRRWVVGGAARFCPVCGHGVDRFFRFGGSNRPGAWCPMCEALERTRLSWLFLQRHTDLCDGRPRRLLHVAPEEALVRLFRSLPNLRHVTADLEPRPGVSVRIDVTGLGFPDESFDAVFCSHVLEHVADDRRAMGEIRRVLVPGGWAMLPVPPIRVETTEEDPSVQDPAERRRRFGHPEHVRRYGRDYPDRLREAGFQVRALTAVDLVGERDTERYGLGSGDEVFFCTR